MKKTALILVLMASFAFAKAQAPFKMKNYKEKDTVYSDTINFFDNKNILDDTLRFNRKYKYVLKNINRFVYKEATAEQKGENLNTERPEIFKGISVPAFVTGQNIQLAEEFIERAPDSIKRSADTRCNCITPKSFIESSRFLYDLFTAYNTSGAAFTGLAGSFFTYPGINKGLEKLKLDVIHSWRQIDSSKRKILLDSLGLSLNEKDFNNNIYKKYDTIRNATEFLYTIVKSSAKPIILAIDSVISNYDTCIYNLIREMRCMDSCCRKPAKTDTCQQVKNFLRKEDEVRRLKKCIAELKAFADGLKADIKEAGAAVDEMGKAFADGKIDAVQNNYNLLVEENFQLELEPFKADKDIHEITFTAGAEGPLPFGKPVKRTIKVNTFTCGNWKIDYSTGVFFNHGNNRFLGPEYYYEHPTDTTKIIREAGRTKKWMLSIGALMHISPRINFPLRPALSVGVSTTSSFETLNFHGGLSIIIGRPGKANRVILSGGITLREVDLLNSRYALDVEKKDYPDAVPVSKNFPIRGGFFAITYNLKGVNK